VNGVRILSCLVPIAVLFFAATARAADAGSAANDGGDEAIELLRSIASQAEALSTDDCAAACRALGSMRRAADRLCTLDPGRRCTEARARVDEAARKVREACPGCAVAMPQSEDEKPSIVHAPAKGGVSGGSGAPEATVNAQAAPPSESRRGGCAGCSGSSGGHGGTSALSLVGAVALALRLVRGGRRRR
jgi:hypothetical protein